MNYLLTGENTERLKFRIVSKDDYDSWLPLFKEDKVAEFLGMPENLSQSEQCDFWFNKVFHRYEHNLGGMNALIEKTSDQLIGQAGLLIQDVEGEKRLEVGYSILPKYWNKGYAREAAIKCKNFCFENGLADNLISIVHVDNIGSEIVALKNGMTFEKLIDDCKVYCITKAQWVAQKQKS